MELNYYHPVSNNNNTNWIWDGEYPSQPNYYYYNNNDNFNDNNILNSNYTKIQDYTSVQYFDAPPINTISSPPPTIFDSQIYQPKNDFINSQSSILYTPESISYPSSAEQSPANTILPPALDEKTYDLDTLLNELNETDFEAFFTKDDDFNNLLENVDFDDSFIFDNNIPDTNNNDNTILNETQDNLNYESNSFDLKRKLSIDSSISSSSLDYLETPFSSPSSSFSSCLSSSSSSPLSSGSISDNGQPKKRNRKSKHTREERAARKKVSNKKAALRYRSKKKEELEIHEQILEQLENRRQNLQQEFKKIETEFNVILPLAKAAFQHDHIRSEQLKKLLSRLSSSNLF